MKIIILSICLLILSCSSESDMNQNPYKSQAWEIYQEINSKSRSYSLIEIKRMLGEPTTVDDKYMWEQGKSFIVIKFDNNAKSISAFWGDHY